jgi:hypothetical protein
MSSSNACHWPFESIPDLAGLRWSQSRIAKLRIATELAGDDVPTSFCRMESSHNLTSTSEQPDLVRGQRNGATGSNGGQMVKHEFNIRFAFVLCVSVVVL